MDPLSQRLMMGAAGGGPPVYIEDVFSTWLYTGTGSAQTITNGIDLATKGGLVWIKIRSSAFAHSLFDTARGTTVRLDTASTAAQATNGGTIAFNANGFTTPNNESTSSRLNETYASWTFRRQPKFFDVVTYTGNGVAGRTVAHNLGSVPGCIIVKQTSAAGQDWMVYHRSLVANGYLLLNSTGAVGTYPYLYGPTSTTFTVDSSSPVNANGATYVAYLFAHDAGGFGASGTDNVISCGSFTTDASTNATINIGWEPQWILTKDIGMADDWRVSDSMRGIGGIGTGSITARLVPNTSGAENALTGDVKIFATGANISLNASRTYIYIAIRRGPMRTPTSGTSVFSPKLVTATQSTQNVTGVGFSPDMIINGVRSNANYGQQVTDRLRGVTKQVFTEYDSAENTTNGTALVSLDMDGFTLGSDSAGTGWNAYSGYTSVKWCFKRAPGFFDVVCYSGAAFIPLTVNHNLGVAPELIIIKKRSSGDNWPVYTTLLSGKSTLLNSDSGTGTDSSYPTSISSTSITLPYSGSINVNGSTFVAYLFASCPGVSKVGTYTGTGSTLQVNCGFTTGARFVLIRRVDGNISNWYVWDSARGIIAGNDPYLALNSAAAEVTSTDWVDTLSTGFEVSNAGSNLVNVNGGTYIFLAIA